MSDESKTISREELYGLVWSKPTTELAIEFGISDVGFGKICNKLNVPKPPPGYWQRVASGYKVKRPPLPSLGDEQRNQVTIWPSTRKPKFEAVNPVVIELLEREKLPENRIVVSENLRGAHSLVSYTNKVLSKAKPDSYGRLMLPWNAKVERPYLDLRVSKQALHRSLRIMDALLKAMEARGHKIESDKGPRFVVNGQKINFYISEKVKRSEREPTPVEKERPWLFDRWIFTPSGELNFAINEFWIERKNWRDRKNKRLEDQLNDIVAGIIRAAETISIKKIEREAEMERWRASELRRQERELRQQIEHERLLELEKISEVWKRSETLRLFVQACESALLDGMKLPHDSATVGWLAWALAQSSELNPLKNGRVHKMIERYQVEEANRVVAASLEKTFGREC